MDNILQIAMISKYRVHLCRIQGKEVDLETAAVIWIKRYAQLWRQKHATGKMFFYTIQGNVR